MLVKKIWAVSGSPFFMQKFSLTLVFLFLSILVCGQDLGNRIEADYTIKEIAHDGGKSLIIGKVFYDINSQTLLHRQSFPEERLIIFKDTSAYQVKGDSIFRTSSSSMTVQFSIYHLVLSNEITDFGLVNMGFELVNVDDQQGKVVSKWKYPGASSGYVAITQDQGLVDGVLFYNEKGEAVVKQYFKEYVSAGRFSFPGKIYEFINSPGGGSKKITVHNNIKVDDFEDESEYYNLFDDVILEFIKSGSTN